MKMRTALLFAIVIICISCGPSQAELDATANSIEADNASTKTAEAPTPTPTPPPTPIAEDILRESVSALEGVESYHFEMDLHMKLKEGGVSIDMPIAFEGDFQSPDRVQSNVSMTFSGITFVLEQIIIGDTQYSTNPETGEWEVMAETISPFGPSTITDM